MDTSEEQLRSYVDPATNETLIVDFNLSNYLNWMKSRPVSGNMLLANFLHEWTHRWCFHSPVGNALALLRLRAGARLLQNKSAHDDYARCMTATAILEPLAEGLSLFAEFDTYPGKSSWLSQTLVASSMYFSPAVETDNRPELLLQGMLQQLRRDPIMVERKAGVYAQTGLDPYLLGYLSVKSLWTQMAAGCNELNDRDLFLSYLRSYFYDDPGLVTVLLSPETNEIKVAADIVNYILDRIQELVSFKNLPTSIRNWMESAHSGQISMASIGSSEEIKQESLRLLDLALIEDIPNGGNENIAAWIYMVLEERSICVLGSVLVTIKPKHPDQAQIFDGNSNTPVFTINNSELLDIEEGELFVIGTSDACAILFFVRTDLDAILVSSFGEYSENDFELAKRHVVNQPRSRSVLKSIRALLAKDDGLELIWKHIGGQLDPALKLIYGPLCTLNAATEIWEQTFEKLQEVGLHGVLGHDGELTRALAGISLLNCFTTDIELIRGLAPVLDIGDEFVSKALELDNPFGLPVIAKSDQSVMAFV